VNPESSSKDNEADSVVVQYDDFVQVTCYLWFKLTTLVELPTYSWIVVPAVCCVYLFMFSGFFRC